MPVRYAINAALFVIFLLVMGLLIQSKVISNYYNKIIMLIGINIILAVSLNVATGYLGQLPLGHAGFMAVGAYASAIFMKATGAADFYFSAARPFNRRYRRRYFRLYYRYSRPAPSR